MKARDGAGSRCSGKEEFGWPAPRFCAPSARATAFARPGPVEGEFIARRPAYLYQVLSLRTNGTQGEGRLLGMLGPPVIPDRLECRAIDGGRKAALLAEASLLSAAFALGTNPVAVKYAVGEVPALPFVAFRFAMAGLLLLVLLRLLGQWEPVGKGDLLRLAALGIVGVGLNNVLFTFGVGVTSASNTALIYATPPLWGMLLGFLLGTESPRARGVVGVAVALLGVGVVVYGGLRTGGGGLKGDLLVSGAAMLGLLHGVLGPPPAPLPTGHGGGLDHDGGGRASPSCRSPRRACSGRGGRR